MDTIVKRMKEKEKMWYMIDRIKKLIKSRTNWEQSDEEKELWRKIEERLNYLRTRIDEMDESKGYTHEDWEIIKETNYALENIVIHDDGSIGILFWEDAIYGNVNDISDENE